MLHLHHLTKTYQQNFTAVDHVTLTLPQGQILGLLGTNGAGKTTTIKMISGLITPTSGNILVDGQDIRHHRRSAMKKLGVVLEGTRNIYWRLSAWQNLMYFGRLKGLHGKELKGRVVLLLEEMGLWERRHDSAGQFSRGMQQKLAIAAALIHDPQLILLDEPTLGLDVQSARAIKDLMLKLVHDQGKTIVLTTHQLDLAQSVSDRIAIMRKGKILTHQSKADLMQLFSQEVYEIRIGGYFQAYNGFITRYDAEETLLSGEIGAQADLFGLISQIQEAGLPLLSVNRKMPTLEDIFIHVHTE